jgi:YbgC/YbaW family acyl-CoA thioester hydrolase
MQVPKVPPSEQIRFRARLRTRWSDEDNQNVLNNAVHLTLLEEARHAYFGGLGLLEQNHFPFVLGQTNICYLAPGVGGAEVEVELKTMMLGRTSFLQAYRIHEVARELVLCEAESLFVGWDNAKAEKCELSEVFRSAVEAYEGRA